MIPPDSTSQFVVVESSTCRLPSFSRLSHSTSAEQKNDTIDENEDVSQQFQTNGKVFNMRVDIKMKVHRPSGLIAPPSTPSPTQDREDRTTALESQATSSTEICVSNISCEDEAQQYGNLDSVDAYAAFARSNKTMLRNRSAPPTISQYRSRLSVTSQWIKKRAVLESTNSRKQSKVGRPKTSVRPFSERETSDDDSKLQLTKICIEPPTTKTAMPDLGYFRGKPPITPVVRSTSKINTRNCSIQYKARDVSTNGTVDDKSASSRYILRNKNEFYVSDLGKSVKTLNGRIQNIKRYKTTLQDNFRNAGSVKGFEIADSSKESNDEKTLDLTSAKSPRPQTVSQKVIDELSTKEEAYEKKQILEIKGKLPPAISSSEKADEETENTASSDKFPPQNLTKDNIVFQRSKTMPQKLSYQTATHASNGPLNKDVSVNYILNRLQYYHRKRVVATPGMARKENLLPYLRLNHSLNGYKSKSTEILHNPFGRTLI